MSDAAIWERLGEMKQKLAELEGRVTRCESGGGSGARASSGGGGSAGGGFDEVASDSDLDGQHGDPTIKYDPKDKYWNIAHGSYITMRFSECPPEYLEAMANGLSGAAYGLEKYADEAEKLGDRNDAESKRKKAWYKRKDAARARGWALRKQGAPQQATTTGGGGSLAVKVVSRAAPQAGDYDNYDTDDIPFIFDTTIADGWERA